MELRSGQVVGSEEVAPLAVAGLPGPQGKAAFEEGVTLLFRRWTALNLAVENQWGGVSSADKANWLLQECIQWFYASKEHYWDDLEEELEDALVQDFNLEAEDGSPAEIAKAACALYKQCCQGDFSTVLQLRAAAARPSGAAQSRQQVVDRDGTVVGEGSDSDSDEEDDMMDAEGGAVPQGVPLVAQAPHQPQAPVIDEDGFQLVQPKGRGGRGGRK